MRKFVLICNKKMPEAKPKIVAIVQARMGSARLPGKALMHIEKKPMVLRVVERLKKAKHLDEIVLAIPDTKENDTLEKFAKENDIIYVRGSEEDVLSRYYKAAKEVGADVVVRITADCPLVDPVLVDEMIQHHLNCGSGYTSNIIERTYPIGLDVEVFNFDVLEKVDGLAKSERHREHVTLYILDNLLLFEPLTISAKKELKNPYLRLTVDTKEDLTVIRKIYKYFGEADFSTKDVIDFLSENPKITKINSHIKQKEFVVLRKAEQSDIKFLFNLRNEKYVYENSRVARTVEWGEHINWVSPVIEGKTNKELFIIEYDRKLAGQLRLDYDGDEAEVSISLLKEFHGKGLATRALFLIIIKRARKLKKLLAEVNEKNIASRKLFEKVGFKLVNKEGGWLKYYLPLKLNEGNKNS